MEQKISGVVVLVIDIDPLGKPVDIVVERAEPAGVFDQAAVDAAWKWTFTPELENGKPVASRVRVPVEFEIPPGEGGAGTVPGISLTTLSQTGQVVGVACDKMVASADTDKMTCFNN